MYNDLGLFERPLKGEIVYSKCNDVYTCNSPRQSLILLVSPISSVLNQYLVQVISSACSSFRNAGLCGRSNGDVHGRTVPRLSTCAKVRTVKIQLLLQSLLVAIESEPSSFDGLEGASKRLWRVALEETLSDLLSLLVCFPPPFLSEAADEAKKIAIGRISAMGLSYEEARCCVRFAVDKYILRLGAMEAGARTRSESGTSVLGTVGLSPRYVDSEVDLDENEESDKVVDRLIQRAVEDTVSFALNLKPVESRQVEWSKALIFDLPTGIRLDAESFFYDWTVTGKVESCFLRNGGGRNLISMVAANPDRANDGADGAPAVSGFLFTFTQKDVGEELGQGGLPLSSLCDDVQIHQSMINRKLEREVQASLGAFKMQFSDKDCSNAVEAVDLLFVETCCFESDADMSKESSCKESIFDGLSASLDLIRAEILLCTDNFQPFTKVVFEDMSVDIVSSSALKEQEKAMLVSARSEVARVFDLSPEGQIFEEMLSSETHSQRTEPSFQMTMTLSNNKNQFPSELLIVLKGVRLLFLRRYLNELVRLYVSKFFV